MRGLWECECESGKWHFRWGDVFQKIEEVVTMAIMIPVLLVLVAGMAYVPYKLYRDWGKPPEPPAWKSHPELVAEYERAKAIVLDDDFRTAHDLYEEAQQTVEAFGGIEPTIKPSATP